MVMGLPIVPGHVFWFDSGKTDEDTPPKAPTKAKDLPPRPYGQEEAELHPWIVISTEEFHRKTRLVLAVPCTSVAVEHAFDVEIGAGAIRPLPNSSKPLSTKKPSRVAKARKIRHFSVDRIVDVVGIVDDEELLIEIRMAVLSALNQ